MALKICFEITCIMFFAVVQSLHYFFIYQNDTPISSHVLPSGPKQRSVTKKVSLNNATVI